MFGRIFGRDKDDPGQAVCAECGRTLLAGEWTQTVVGADGEELVICSLCGQSRDFGDEAPAAVSAPAPANNGRVRETRTEAPRDAHGESDAFWKALKDKDAEIERLRAALGRARSGLVVAETTLGWVAARCYDSIFADENYRDLLTAEDVARTSVYRIDDALADQGGTCCD